LSSARFIKLYFVVFTLSYSRYKWGIFQDHPFKAADLVRALYGCFYYYGGMPRELVYDQDSIIVVSENNGDIVHTQAFTVFLSETKLGTRVCRRNDPETKGLIESTVKFVKGNFMENRHYMGLEAWNESFEDWLERTGNGRAHWTTKRKPSEMFMEEQEHLLPLYGDAPAISMEEMERAVRQDNTILYLSNRYSVPLGTYGRLKTVFLRAYEGKLEIMDSAGDTIAKHEINAERGKLIKLDGHRRDRESRAQELLNKAVGLLGEESRGYLTALCEARPRYVKEQLGLVADACETYGRERVMTAMGYCREMELYSAVDLKDTAASAAASALGAPARPMLMPPIK
jgi:hypothetical protein